MAKTKEEWMNYIQECIKKEDGQNELSDKLFELEVEIENETSTRNYYFSKMQKARTALNIIKDAASLVDGI